MNFISDSLGLWPFHTLKCYCLRHWKVNNFPGSFHPSSVSLSPHHLSNISCLFPSFFEERVLEWDRRYIHDFFVYIACAEWDWGTGLSKTCIINPKFIVHHMSSLHCWVAIVVSLCAFCRETMILFRHNTSISSNILRYIGETNSGDFITYVSYMSPYICVVCAVVIG